MKYAEHLRKPGPDEKRTDHTASIPASRACREMLGATRGHFKMAFEPAALDNRGRLGIDTHRLRNMIRKIKQNI